MSVATAHPTEPGSHRSTTGRVQYVEAPPGEKELYTYIYEIPEGQPASNIVRNEREVSVTDIRPHVGNFTLAKNGVELHKLKVPDDINWDDEKEVENKLYPHVKELLLKATGASRVHIFDHTLRRGHLPPESNKEFKAEQRGKPVGMVHVDYTAPGGLRRLHMVFPEEAEKLKKTPFAIVQVWRPLKGPVQSSPLGVIDAATVDKEDLINYRLEFPGRTGFNYGVKYNPKHKWYYASGIDADEAYVFVCYDSRSDRARFTPHTGFWDNSTAPDAPQRESVELRSFCFFENEPEHEVAAEL